VVCDAEWVREFVNTTFVFRKLRNILDYTVDTTEEILVESQRVLDTLTENDFQEAFQRWRRL
jgi:hypothetical protein